MLRYFALSLLTLTLLAHPAMAQDARLAVTGKKIVVTKSIVDPATGARKKVDQWDWLDLRVYFEKLSLLRIQPMVPANIMATIKPTGDYLDVTETGINGNLDREIRLYNGIMVATNYVYDYSYSYDFNELGKLLAAERDRQMALKTPRPAPTAPLLSISTIDEKSGEEFKWFINDMNSVLLIKSYLEKLPKMTYAQITRDVPEKYVAPDSFIITAMTPEIVKKFPQVLSVGKNTIRFTTITPWTHAFYDKFGFTGIAIDQRQLGEHYKSLGLPPVKTY